MKLYRSLLIVLIFCKPFCCFSNQDEQQEIMSAQKTVKILSLNRGLMSVFFGTISVGLKKNSNRAYLLAKTIKFMNSEQPDVIAFQEAFDQRRLQMLYNTIKDIYPYAFFDERLGAFLGGVDSGLVIFSKYPIVKKMIKDFDCWAGIEALARKGVMGVELSVDGCPLYLFNTHLQAGVDREWYVKMFGIRPRSCEGEDPGSLTSSQIVQKELRQAAQEIKKFVGTQNYFNLNSPILFVGDFNISRLRDSQDYDAFLKTFPGALDTYYKGSQTVKSTSWQKGFVADTETDRVDYIWLLNPSSAYNVHSNIVKTFTESMTDHLGILSELSFCSKD
jgi:endonuclease/exonuclease/phosphatase family metal-dependent hydrolase